MLDVISQLRDRGWDVTWDVYGAGPLEVAMQARIVKLQLQERVTLWGETAYRDLEQAIQSAYAFVGMGTALIEAGRCGIPSVPAIVYGGTRTYGYVYELPLGAVGEHLGPEPGIECRVLLERLLSMDDAGYEQESQRTRTYCAQYDIQQVGPRFVDAVERGDRLPTHSPRRAAALWIASWVYCVGQAYRSARNAMVRAATRLLAPSLTCRLRAMARLRQTDRESSPPK